RADHDLCRRHHPVRSGDDGDRPLPAWERNVRRGLALVLLLLAGSAHAEPAVVASGAYPEGLLWHDGRLYFTEMGADRVTVVENGTSRQFWHMPGCGPTQIVRFGTNGFVVDCHLGRAMVEVTAAGTTGRRFTTNRDG